MALYLSLVLAAEFLTLEGHPKSVSYALSLLWGTAVGLTLAHLFAFNLSGLVFSRGKLDAIERGVVMGQVGAAAAVATILSLPFLVFHLAGAVAVDRVLIALFVALNGWAIAKAAGGSAIRALTLGLLMLALALAVVTAKAALSVH